MPSRAGSFSKEDNFFSAIGLYVSDIASVASVWEAIMASHFFALYRLRLAELSSAISML